MTQYLRNAWYMAGWSEEVGDTILSRRIFERKIALFRKSDGTVTAIPDRCPHRFAPLSDGMLKDGTITCSYHGLTFGGDGVCVANPWSDRIPAAAKVQSWTCIERDGIIWIWGGEGSDADLSLIPDFAQVADSDTVKVVRGYTLLKAPYEFGTDNLMDLSHIEFVHRGSFAGNGVVFAGEHKVIEEGNSLHSNWWMPRVAAPTHTRGRYPPDLTTDHWLEMRWNAPASMQLEIGSCPTGTAREGGVIDLQAHILTPADADTAHYFWASARQHELDNPQVDAFLVSLFSQAFDDEDKPVIEAAWRNLEGEDFWDAKPLSLGIDAGGTRARRKLQALIAAEGETR